MITCSHTWLKAELTADKPWIQWKSFGFSAQNPASPLMTILCGLATANTLFDPVIQHVLQSPLRISSQGAGLHPRPQRPSPPRRKWEHHQVGQRPTWRLSATRMWEIEAEMSLVLTTRSSRPASEGTLSSWRRGLASSRRCRRRSTFQP